MNARIAALAAALLFATGTGTAQVHLAYGPEYEDQFRVACAASFPARDCQCGLERLQRSVGFNGFAAAMVRDGDTVLRAREAGSARVWVESCAGGGDVAVPLVTLAADRPSQADTERAAAQHLCRSRAAAIAPRIKVLVDRAAPRGTAELQAVVANIANARVFCAAGDFGRAVATYDHVAAFLDTDGFGDAITAP